jgi:hypothetical protein
MWIESFQDFRNPKILRTSLDAFSTTPNKQSIIEDKLFWRRIKKDSESYIKTRRVTLFAIQEKNYTNGGRFHLIRGMCEMIRFVA